MGDVQIVRAVCPVCGKQFVQKTAIQKFCSVKCRQKAQNKRHADKVRQAKAAQEPLRQACAVCGRVFEPRKNGAKYCSRKCCSKAAYQRKKEEEAPKREQARREKEERAQKLEKMVQQVKQRQSSAGVTAAEVAAEAARQQPMTLNEAVAAADAAGIRYGMWQVHRRTQIYQQLRQKKEEKKS